MVKSSQFKKVKRGGRGNKKNKFVNSDKWSIYLSNIRGYDSKRLSLQNIIGCVKPSLVVLNETHYQHGKKLKLQGYNCFNRNRRQKCKGGIATAVVNTDAMHTLKVKEGDNDDEFLITRHSQFVTPVNVINIYGEQECRSRNDDIQKRWDRIMSEVIKIEAKNEWVVMLGDMNKHVGDIIDGNHKKSNLWWTVGERSIGNRKVCFGEQY